MNNNVSNSFLLKSFLCLIALISACSNETNVEETPSKEILVYINSFDEETKSLTFDEVEWISHLDTERIKEVGLDPESDFPSGFQVYNESEQTASLKVADDVQIDVVNGANLQEPLKVDIQGLAKRIQVYKTPFYLTIKNNVIIKISEKYTP
ncbi:hypothetical protein ACFVR1_14615 [Psychrobacillus sp. NPDC058041]|uniref:hypothetical protein n=1 Tax=Psychrobacillus sp. NPDC058041 TaxID=3346310 RepID=UPI0036D7CF94